MSFRNLSSLVRTKFFSSKARDPQIPISLEEKLYVFNFYFVITVRWSILYSVLCQQARSIDHILYEFVSDLQQAVFDFFVELLVRVDFAHELLKARLCKKLEVQTAKFS